MGWGGAVETVGAGQVKSDELALVDQVVAELGETSALGTVLASLAGGIRSGNDIVVANRASHLSPAQAATLLGVSRGHLYKMMDAGSLAFHRVGRDRRLELPDVLGLQRRDLS